MKLNPIVFKIVTRTIALTYAIPFLFLFPLALAFGSDVKWLVGNYFFVSLGGIYVTGLLLGLKWPGLGGLISIIFPMIQIIQMTVSFLKGPSPGNSVRVICFFIALSIPCILYLADWKISRKNGKQKNI